mgnify:CR=1 FL=1
MANNKDFVVDGFVNVGGSIEQNTGLVSSSVSTEDAANISETSLSVITHAGSGRNGISFSSDGTKIFGTSTAEVVYEYALSTAWDLTTVASTHTTSLDVSAVVGALNGLCFNSDGTKMYLIDGTSADTLYQYTLSTAFVLSTATYANKSFYFGASATYVYGNPSLHNNDQTLLLPEYVSGQKMCVYTLSTPGDITTATLTSSRRFTELVNPQAATFNSDGTKLYAKGSAGDVYEFNLATAYSVASAATSTFNSKALLAAQRGFFIKPDDTLLFGDDGSILTFTYSQTNLNADLSTGQVFTLPLNKITSVALSNPPVSGQVQNFKINLDGSATRSYYDIVNADAAASSKLSGPFTLVNATLQRIFVKDSTRFYVIQYTSTATVYTYNMINFDVSTAVLAGSRSMNNGGGSNFQGDIFFSPDGTKFYIQETGTKSIRLFNLSAPWEIDSETYVGSTTYSTPGSHKGFYYKPDGSRFYIAGSTGNKIHQYDQSTAWSQAGGVAAGSFTLSGGTPQDMFFKPDGTKFFIATTTGFNEYSLSTAWDVTTASFTGLGAGDLGFSTGGFADADGGEKIFVVEGGKVDVYPFGVTVAATFPSNFTWQYGEPSLNTNYTSYAVTSDGGTTYLLK